MMSSVNTNQKNVEKEELLQAVVVVDDFEGFFADYTEDGPALFPMVNLQLIDCVLISLSRNGFEDVILFCSSHVQALQEHLKNSSWMQPSSKMKVTVLVSEKCFSLGDALRDIDHKALIKGDFLLMSSFTITNIDLKSILNKHKQTRLKDKGTALTLVLQDIGSRKPKLNDSIYVTDTKTDKLLMHVKASSQIGKFEIPLERLLENVNLKIFSNLKDTGIAICSPSVPLLFSDNFDFQSIEDFIQGLLLNEGILDSRIYCHEVGYGYGATIRNWQSYQRVSLDCIHKWVYPFIPGLSFMSQPKFYSNRNFVYRHPEVQSKNVMFEMDVVIEGPSKIGQYTKISRSVIGKNCVIGQNVVIRDSFIFNNTVIEDNCEIVLCVLGENSKVQENSKLSKCFLKRNVLLNPKAQLEEVVVVSKPLSEKWTKHSEKAYFMKIKSEDLGSDDDLTKFSQSGLIDSEAFYSEEEEINNSSESDPDNFYSPALELDDTEVFYSEVVDSLHRGFEEKLSCENLILEINSSRYAYNITLSDVTVLTLKGILLLSPAVKATRKEVLTYFLPLLKNYIKTSKSQMKCLDLIRSISGELGNEVAKCIHFLYDKDIISEENILKWNEELEFSPVKNLVAPLIKWLIEAESEDSS